MAEGRKDNGKGDEEQRRRGIKETNESEEGVQGAGEDLAVCLSRSFLVVYFCVSLCSSSLVL